MYPQFPLFVIEHSMTPMNLSAHKFEVLVPYIFQNMFFFAVFTLF